MFLVIRASLNEGRPPSAYLNSKSPVESHDALTDTLLLGTFGPSPATDTSNKSPTLPRNLPSSEDDGEEPAQKQREERSIQPG